MFARSTTPSLIVIGTSHIATLALAVEAPAARAAAATAPTASSRRRRLGPCAPVEVPACGCRRRTRATKRSIDAPDEMALTSGALIVPGCSPVSAYGGARARLVYPWPRRPKHHPAPVSALTTPMPFVFTPHKRWVSPLQWATGGHEGEVLGGGSCSRPCSRALQPRCLPPA